MVSQTLTIPNLRAGSDYLCELSLGNPMLAEEQMAVFLNALTASPPEPDTLLTLLEEGNVPDDVILRDAVVATRQIWHDGTGRGVVTLEDGGAPRGASRACRRPGRATARR